MIANVIASLHSLVLIAMDILGPQFDNKGLQFGLIAILDTVLKDSFLS